MNNSDPMNIDELNDSVNEEQGPNLATGVVESCFNPSSYENGNVEGWEKAHLYIFDAPFCQGDVKDRLEYLRHWGNIGKKL